MDVATEKSNVTSNVTNYFWNKVIRKVTVTFERSNQSFNYIFRVTCPTMDLIKHNGATPADTTNHHWLHTGLQAAWILCLSTLPPDFRPWFPNEMQNLLLSGKRTLALWATVQFFFSLAKVRCFWHCFCFRSGLVDLFLKMSDRGNSWCTDSSFSPLLVKLSQVFESVLLDSIIKLAVIPVACAHFPTQFLPSSCI